MIKIGKLLDDKKKSRELRDSKRPKRVLRTDFKINSLTDEDYI